MTKYKVDKNGILYEYIRKYKDYKPEPKFMNKIPKGTAIDKLFSNPVTSIAYTHEFPKTLGSDYDMDKKDIIKALDFWINDKVLQNEKLLALNGNLKDFEETELKSLIHIKQCVIKMPNDTIFKRFNRTDKYGYDRVRSDTVEFWYQVVPIPEMNTRQHIPTISDDNRNIRGEFTFNWRSLGGTVNAFDHISRAASFDDDEHRFDFGDTTPVSPPGYFRVGDDDFRNHIIVGNDPNRWTVHRRTDGLWLVQDERGMVVEDSFPTNAGAEVYIHYHIDRYNALMGSSTVATEEHNTTFENMYIYTINTSSNRNSVEVQFRGTNGAEMTVNLIPNHRTGHTDIVTEGPHHIQLLGNNMIRIDEQEYTVTEPIRVSYNR